MAPRSALFVAVASVCVALCAANSLIVDTSNGPVMGVDDTLGSQHWMGIPYAADTGGANRFLPPKPPTPWTSPFNATYWGPGCVQTGHNADDPSVQSEDCLNLNVFAPKWANASSKLPVMLFFHGGAFVEGSNRGPFFMYDSDYIVSTKDVIVVTSNYRLGAFGWMVIEGLFNGNQGFQDQIMAMQWVQKNIGNFGGDASRVTLWGESAGAMSGGLHLVSPASKGLFSQLIMESNPSGFRYRSISENSNYGMETCKQMNCMSGSSCNMTCLQSATVENVEHGWGKAGGDIIVILESNFHHILDAILACTPTIDGTLIPENPMIALPAGKFQSKVPMLFGTNNNEGSTFVYAALHESIPPFLIDLAFDVVFGGTVGKEIAERYKYITDPDGRTLISRVITDYYFRCSSEQFAVYATKAGTPAYVYRYDHLFSDATLFPRFGLPTICENRTCHGSELPFVFHDVHIEKDSIKLNVTMTPVEKALSQSFVDYWTSFAIHGNPNTGNNQAVEWPLYTLAGRENIVLQDKIATENTTSLCGFWDPIGYDH